MYNKAILNMLSAVFLNQHVEYSRNPRFVFVCINKSFIKINALAANKQPRAKPYITAHARGVREQARERRGSSG